MSSHLTENAQFGQSAPSRVAEGFYSNIREGQEAADLTSIASDLRQVVDVAKILVEQTEDEGFDALRLALLDSVVIRYRRCFTTGIRMSLKRSDVLQAAPQYEEIHSFFYDLGNKHIAHSVSALEQTADIVYLDQSDPRQPRVAAISVTNMRGNVPNINVARLGELATILIDRHIQPEISRLSEVFRQRAETLPVERLRKLKPAMMPVNLNGSNIADKRYRSKE